MKSVFFWYTWNWLRELYILQVSWHSLTEGLTPESVAPLAMFDHAVVSWPAFDGDMTYLAQRVRSKIWHWMLHIFRSRLHHILSYLNILIKIEYWSKDFFYAYYRWQNRWSRDSLNLSLSAPCFQRFLLHASVVYKDQLSTKALSARWLLSLSCCCVILDLWWLRVLSKLRLC